ncbi:MAG: GspE/PulE family protein, partial [Candidatus Binatia bacterium]
TTLYSAISELNDASRNVSTAEDPVELKIEGISQLHVNEEIGLTFARALRTFLRQDPDVIMVGEIRDTETAQIAIKAALTGHLVLSTLHTNDAPSAISRYLDMGVEPFLVASSVHLIVAQRLVRRICTHCKTRVEYPEAALAAIGFAEEEAGALELRRGAGCHDCADTGYHGRLALFEVMPVDSGIRPLILGRASAEEIGAVAIRHGMQTLRRSGLARIRDGLTTIEEVLRVTASVD